MLAVLAPGQGAQSPGMLAPWLDLPGVPARLRWLSALCGLDLVRLGTTAEAAEIQATEVTQPLLVAFGLVAAEQLPLHDVTVVAGHSVGELTAAALAGVFSAESAITLAAARGRAMAAACGEPSTAMAAVLGGEPDEVLRTIETYGLTAANRNGAGQVVAAGAVDAVRRLSEQPPARSRVIPLRVAGAFHTSYMASAEQSLAAIAEGVPTADPVRLLLSNADGTAVPTGGEVIKRLVAQVTSPVRWDLCQATMGDLGVTAAIELPPAGTLAGLARRELKGVEMVALKTPEDLAAARDLIARHGGPPGAEPSVAFRVLVAPAAGTFATSAAVSEGDFVTPGTSVGQVITRQGAHEVTLSYPAVLAEWLVVDGDPVGRGQPLARLQPQGVAP
ncbi:MAG: acyltransferase domain-containing protein [Pseudonocardiales bacterium]